MASVKVASREAIADPYLEQYEHEPYLDFTDSEDRRRMTEALAKVRQELGGTYPLVIGGEEITGGEMLESTNPARPDEVVGRVPVATIEHAERAIDAAWDAFEDWRFVAVEERVELCFRARDIVRERIFELAAWVVYEAGKNWVEAYADVAETVDFFDFYARQMLRLAAPQPLSEHPSEELELEYIPLGVGAMIPPWNFPVAIAGGMTIASILGGNTVVLKPAPDTPITGYKLFEVLRDAGLPDGVVNFLPGEGRPVGSHLVEHPRTRYIAFTGSRDVGTYISEEAGKVRPGQKWIKRAILEMGGKDAMVIDSEADLDVAVPDVVKAAFGYTGQKCSAGSRAIVDAAVYDEFLDRLVEAAKKVTVGPPDDPDNWMGPLINEAAMEKVLGYIEVGRDEGRLLLGGGRAQDAGPGWFVEPTIFADVDPDARIAQEEVFGPFLTVIEARDYDDALRIANGTEYGLTGAVYSRNAEKLDRARREFHVGNLYLNRPCTGAIVGCHPFGGFNMSGTDSKTGGRDYMLLYTQAKSIAERVR